MRRSLNLKRRGLKSRQIYHRSTRSPTPSGKRLTRSRNKITFLAMRRNYTRWTSSMSIQEWTLFKKKSLNFAPRNAIWRRISTAECATMKFNKTSSRISNGSPRQKKWSWNARSAKSSWMPKEGKEKSTPSEWPKSERSRKKNSKQELRLGNRERLKRSENGN